MTVTERRNYLIAMLVSLAFHLLLAFVYIPKYLIAESNGLQTYPVGMVELAAGSNPLDESNGVTASFAEEKADQLPESIVQKIPDGEKKDQKSALDSEDKGKKPVTGTALNLPKKEGIAISGESNARTKTGGESTSGESGGVNGKDSQVAGKTGKPIGFGTGEGMITVLGPLPPYPKNAMNEGKEGEVAIRIMVKADGSLEQINLTRTSGDLRLDKVVVSSIERTWKFKSVVEDYYVDLTFSFTLKSGVSLKFLYSESRP